MIKALKQWWAGLWVYDAAIQEFATRYRHQQADDEAKRKRAKLIRSAQRKVAEDGNAKRVTGDEWNALAYEPLREAMISLDAVYKDTIARVDKVR